jgi:hypothetical protein
MMVRWSILFLFACSSTPQRKPAPNLDGTVESFAPTRVPIGQAIGIAAQLSFDATTRAAQLDRLSSLHAGVIRRDFIWDASVPFDFASEDAAVDDTRARGIATIGLLKVPDPQPPPDPSQFAAFCSMVAQHFAGRVPAWEIWNEENLGFRFWHPNEDPAAYVELLAQAHDAIKRADKGALVVFGGLNSEGAATPGEEFLADAYYARPELGRYYDALAVHPYQTYPPQTEPEDTVGHDYSLGLKLARLRAELQYYGDSDKPIWITEVGWPVAGPVDEAHQARYLARASIEAMAAGADRVCLYTLDDTPTAPGGLPATESVFGVYRADGSAKPAVAVLSSLIARDPAATLLMDQSTAALRKYVFSSFTVQFAPTPDGDLQ